MKSPFAKLASSYCQGRDNNASYTSSSLRRASAFAVFPIPKSQAGKKSLSISSNKKDLESYICKWHCRVIYHVDAGDPVYVIILTDGGSQEGVGDDPPDIICFMAQIHL